MRLALSLNADSLSRSYIAWIAVALITLLQQVAGIGEKVRDMHTMDSSKDSKASE